MFTKSILTLYTKKGIRNSTIIKAPSLRESNHVFVKMKLYRLQVYSTIFVIIRCGCSPTVRWWRRPGASSPSWRRCGARWWTGGRRAGWRPTGSRRSSTAATSSAGWWPVKSPCSIMTGSSSGELTSFPLTLLYCDACTAQGSVLEPEPMKKGPALQHCQSVQTFCLMIAFHVCYQKKSFCTCRMY